MEDKIVLTIVKFKIPFGLVWEDSFPVNMGKYVAKIKLKREYNENGIFNFDGAEFGRDRTGRSTYTVVECSFKYINSSNEENLNIGMEVINRTLDAYRMIEDTEFHADKLRKYDLLEYQIIYVKESGNAFGNLAQNYPGSLNLSKLSKKLPEIGEVLLLNGFSFPLWKKALSNALNKFELDDYEDALIQINIAFENFIYTHIYDRLKDIIPKNEIDIFLDKTSPCEKCKYQKSDEKEKIIEPHSKSIYTIANFIYKKAPLENMSKKELNDVFRSINKNRNSLVHGHENIILQKDEVKRAIESFKLLVEKSLVNHPITLTKAYKISTSDIDKMENDIKELMNRDWEPQKSCV